VDSLTPQSNEPYQPNTLLRWLYRRFFAHIEIDEQWSRGVRAASARGVVVYVMRSLSFLDFLCLDYLVKQLSLPLVHFASDLGLWILEPFGKGRRRIGLRRQLPEDRALATTIENGDSALLFLRRPPKLGHSTRRGERLETDLIATLVETQRRTDRPILLVPQTFVWSKLPPKKERTFFDLFFGPSEWPGKVRVFFQFLLNYRNALLRSGEPFDLSTFAAEHPDLSDAQLADKIRYALLRRIERERTLVMGPHQKTPTRLREEILRSPRVRKHIEAHARTARIPLLEAENQARTELRKMCAAQDPYWLGLLHRLLDWLWNRIYAGIEVDKDGMERLRMAARKGSVVLLPSHKSHVDSLVLSDVLYAHALSPPLIAAGDNLSFWPLGAILRRGGGFFIRRSLKGKKLYSALVDAYLRKLLVEGFCVSFFLEGGRSRTGKLLTPKLGLLSMITDAALSLGDRTVSFVPISIGYERIIEERSYVHELSGGDKRTEDIGDLLRTPKILRSRYGRLTVQVGEIFSFAGVAHDVLLSGGGGPAELTPRQRRQVVHAIAHRAIGEIHRATMVTPGSLVATALMSHRGRGIDLEALCTTAATLLEVPRRLGARVDAALVDRTGALRPDAIAQSLALLCDSKLVSRHTEGDLAIYTVPEERRMALEYYKNNILHFFVPTALVSTALVQPGEPLVSRSTLRERVSLLSSLLVHELISLADEPVERWCESVLEAMIQANEIEALADHVRPSEQNRDKVLLYSGVLRTYFESYRLALRGSESLVAGPMQRKEWIKRTVSLGQRMYFSGELELRESISRARIDNALLALRDQGLVRLRDDELLEAGDALRDAEGVRTLDGKLELLGS